MAPSRRNRELDLVHTSVRRAAAKSLHVPVRDIALTNGEQVSVYDTSGPYTDPTAITDVKGLG